MASDFRTGHLAQLAVRRAWYPKGPGFNPGLSPTHIMCLLSLPLAIWNEAMTFFWFLISELRFWNPFWKGRDHYSVQKILAKRKRNSVLQNGNGIELFHDGDALLQSIWRLWVAISYISPYAWVMYTNIYCWRNFQDETQLSWHAIASNTVHTSQCQHPTAVIDINSMIQLLPFRE